MDITLVAISMEPLSVATPLPERESIMAFKTTRYQGYIKLDIINGVGYGWVHSGAQPEAPPHLVGTQIFNCWGNGILANGIVDLSGVHHGSGSPLNMELPGIDDIPGYNQIHDNADAQIVMTETSTFSNPINVWVTQDDHYPNASGWTEAGQNDIYQGSGSTPVLIQGSGFSNTSVVIDSNFWGSGIIPPIPSPSPTNWPGFNFTAPFGSISSTPIPSELVCSSGLDFTKKGIGVKPLSALVADSCGNAINAAGYDEVNSVNYGPAYDTMKWYISHCYKNAIDGTWGAFGQSLDSVVRDTSWPAKCI